MTTRSTERSWPWPILAFPAILVILAGCTGQRLQELSDRAGTKWLNKPVAQAMTELGTPQRQRPIADLREYTWTTGVRGDRGGDCTLALIADARGVVVDYRMDGTPLGCNRLIDKA